MSPPRPSFHSFLRTVIEDFLDSRQRLGYDVKSAKSYLRDLDHYLVFYDIISVRKIDESLVIHWIHSIPSRSNRTKNSMLLCLRKFLDFLIRQGLAVSNPARGVAYLKFKPFKPYLYTLKEIQQLLLAAQQRERSSRQRQGFAWRTVATMIYLIYACGLRLSESLNLRIKDVDFSEDTLSLWKTKFHKERLVPFSDAAHHRLKEYLSLRLKRYPPANSPEEAPFFCHSKGKYGAVCIEYLFRKLLADCRIANPSGHAPRIHDLRHTFACHLLYKWYQEGRDPLNKLPWLATYMGHVNIRSTQVYLTITRALLREGDRRFRDQFENIPASFLKKAIGKACHP